jgi:hypothetical protein
LHSELLAKTREVETERQAKHVALAERATLEGRLAEGQERNAELEARAHGLARCDGESSPALRSTTLDVLFDSPKEVCDAANSPPAPVSMIPQPKSASVSPPAPKDDPLDAAWSSALVDAGADTRSLKKLRKGVYMFGTRRVECAMDNGKAIAKCTAGEMSLDLFVSKFAFAKPLVASNGQKVSGVKMPARVRIPTRATGKENEA